VGTASVALVYPFLALSAVGFAAALAVHVASLFGVTDPFSYGLRYLGPGVFVVALPMILLMNRLTRDFEQKDTWRAALRGCPQWMRRVVSTQVMRFNESRRCLNGHQVSQLAKFCEECGAPVAPPHLNTGE
jgi:hypothetical protein